MKTDQQVQQSVLDELRWEPSVDAAAIGVAVKNGVVSLSGDVKTYAEKNKAAQVAQRVLGVKGVANEVTVKLFGPYMRSDQDIVTAAAQALKWDVWVPDERIHVKVENGWITLSGVVDGLHLKVAADNAVAHLAGVTGVTNDIVVKTTVQPIDVKTKIEAAFQRNAVFDARRIRVAAVGNTVTLTGNVRSWAERLQAEASAASAPGVETVENDLVVLP